MRFFRSAEPPKQDLSKLAQRLKRMETQSVMSWWDTCHMGLGAAFDRWRYHNGPWEEVQENLDALQEIWAEIRTRTDIN